MAAFIRGCMKRVGAILAIGIAGVLLSGEASLAQNSVNVGSCTPGDQKCAADRVLICECYDEWRETDDGETMITVCVWDDIGEYCGRKPTPIPPPACTQSRDGATFEFPDEIKECTCQGGHCYWRTNY